MALNGWNKWIWIITIKVLFSFDTKPMEEIKKPWHQKYNLHKNCWPMFQPASPAPWMYCRRMAIYFDKKHLFYRIRRYGNLFNILKKIYITKNVNGWCVFDERHRTNNVTESYNSKHNKVFKNPSLLSINYLLLSP